VGIREKLNDNPRVAGGIVGAVVILAGVWIYLQNRSPGLSPAVAAKSAFYTEDDGQTYFPGDYANLAKDFKGPNGKEAVRAYVFRYGSEKPFVGYLEKYTPAGKQVLATFYGDSSNEKNPPPVQATLELLLKKPGGKTWTSMKDRREVSMMRMVPNKGEEPPQQVLP
jgi:hypothetical protein